MYGLRGDEKLLALGLYMGVCIRQIYKERLDVSKNILPMPSPAPALWRFSLHQKNKNFLWKSPQKSPHFILLPSVHTKNDPKKNTKGEKEMSIDKLFHREPSLAIATVPRQSWTKPADLKRGLKQGTIFDELK